MKVSAAILAALANLATAKFMKGQGTPDGTSAGVNGASSYCDQYDTNAKALCIKYCYAQDCYLGEGASVPGQVCSSMKEDFIEATGEMDFPCERPCPCWSKVPEGLPFCQASTDGTFIFISDDEFGFLSQEAYAVSTFNNPICLSGGLAGSTDGEAVFVGGIITDAQAETCRSIITASYDESQCTPLEGPRNLRH